MTRDYTDYFRDIITSIEEITEFIEGMDFDTFAKDKKTRNAVKYGKGAGEDLSLDQRFFLLNDEEWQKFREALDRPARFKPGLQKLMQEKAPWE